MPLFALFKAAYGCRIFYKRRRFQEENVWIFELVCNWHLTFWQCSVITSFMEEVDAAEKILNELLGKLGFQVEIEREQTNDGLSLNVLSSEGKHIIGKNGDRLEDLQYLTNRILNKHYPDAPRIKVDCDHYRADQEGRLIETVRLVAQQVAEDGKTRRLKPLNAYYRRIAHNALVEIEGVSGSSPSGGSRYKRIEISKI